MYAHELKIDKYTQMIFPINTEFSIGKCILATEIIRLQNTIVDIENIAF
jgi:hypothetical protein